MKTAEEWMNRFTGLHEPILVTVNQMAIREIQLDAFKAGAEWAAKIAEKSSDEVCCEDPYAHQDIRDALDSLKEIPK